jgi:hypothetical protein
MIRKAIESKAGKWEAEAVMNRLRQALISNVGIITDIRKISIRTSKWGYVTSLILDIVIQFPDAKVRKQMPGQITYKFDGQTYRVNRSVIS